VFVDESGFHTSMTRLYARAPRGKRAYMARFQETVARTLPSSLRSPSRELWAPRWLVEGATDAEAFEAYVEHFLAPTLEKGQAVVLDGLGAHRTEKVRKLVQARGADLVFLPSYSPEMNPIEESFSKVKALVRKEGARVREVLVVRP
jgi:hypothetical protein